MGGGSAADDAYALSCKNTVWINSGVAMRDIEIKYNYRLPDFEPVTDAELRRIWAENPTPEARRLVLEIERYRRFLAEVEEFCLFAQKNINGISPALHMFKNAIYHERFRVPRPK